MLRLWRHFGRLLDAMDLGGWMCLASGIAIVAATSLAPAWLEVRKLRYERQALIHETGVLQATHENYVTFIAAVEQNDPLVLERLAWRHLRLLPADAAGFEMAPASATNEDLDAWMRPAASQVPQTGELAPLPRTKLVRLLLGPTRVWVLGFGGWLILIGLLVTPPRPSAVADGGDDSVR